MATPLSANQVKYLQNLAAGKTETGAAANAGQASWAKSQLAAGGMSATQAAGANKVPVPGNTPQANPGATPKVTPLSADQAKGTPSVPTPVLNAATDTSGNAPAIGYGGATYGTSGAINAGISANAAKIGSDPAFKASEIARTQAVIAERKAQGLDTSAQEKYLTQNLGYVAPQPGGTGVGMTDNGGYIPPDAVTSLRTSDQLQQSAGDSLAIEKAALLNAINTQKQSLKDSAAYSAQLTQDNRTLQDFELKNTLNPFMGRTSYDKAMIGRQRSIDDAAQQAQLTNLLNSYDTELANFDKLAPERQRQIYNELLAAERNFGLQQGQLTGNYGSQRTLAGQQLDWGKTVDTANLTGNLGGQKTLAAQNQQFNQDMANKQFDRGVLESDRAYEYQKARDSIADERYKQEFDYNVQQNGLDYALRKAAQDNQIANTNAQTALDYQSYADKSANSQTSYSGLTSNQIYDAIKSQFASPTYDANGRSTGSKLPTDPTQRKAMITQIINSTAGLSDSQVEQIAASLGVTSSEWKAVTGHGLGE